MFHSGSHLILEVKGTKSLEYIYIYIYIYIYTERERERERDRERERERVVYTNLLICSRSQDPEIKSHLGLPMSHVLWEGVGNLGV